MTQKRGPYAPAPSLPSRPSQPRFLCVIVQPLLFSVMACGHACDRSIENPQSAQQFLYKFSPHGTHSHCSPGSPWVIATLNIPTESSSCPLFSHDKHMIRLCVCWLRGSKAFPLVYFCKSVLTLFAAPDPQQAMQANFGTVLVLVIGGTRINDCKLEYVL
jgi:hypothetical protein